MGGYLPCMMRENFHFLCPTRFTTLSVGFICIDGESLTDSHHLDLSGLGRPESYSVRVKA